MILNALWLDHKKTEHLYLHSNAEAQILARGYFSYCPKNSRDHLYSITVAIIWECCKYRTLPNWQPTEVIEFIYLGILAQKVYAKFDSNKNKAGNITYENSEVLDIWKETYKKLFQIIVKVIFIGNFG